MKKFGLILASLLLSVMAIFADNEKVTRDKSVLPSYVGISSLPISDKRIFRILRSRVIYWVLKDTMSS